MKNYLDELSPAQSEAARNIEGAALIVAGAGSGKTRTLTYRIANMIDNGISPSNILALTFTNKAAREMRERMATIMPASSLRGLWMGTFHGVFRRILLAESSKLGYAENFTIYDTADSRNLIKSVVAELQLPDERYKPKDVLSRISLAKNSLVTPAAYEANATARAEDQESKRGEIYRVYARYTQRCKANGAMDFDDILLQMNYLLRDHPDVAVRYAEMFRYIMVDEYQDTNFSQYLIVKKLAAAHGNICVVGDDSQSIYSFRGARIENILRFTKDFPLAVTYKLEQNYRSTRTIVEASNSLIAHNSQRIDKKLYSESDIGDKIRVVQAYGEKDEAERVAQDIFRTIYSDGASPSDFAVLYRTNIQSRAMEEQLRSRNIAYRIYGGKSFYQRAEIKDMLSYIRLAINPADNEALKRIINTPARGIGATSVSRIEATALAAGMPIFEVLRTMNSSQMGIRGTAVRGIENFVNAFAALSQVAESADAYDFASQVAAKSGILAFYRASSAIEDKSRLDNIEELLNSIKSFTMPEPMGQSDDVSVDSDQVLCQPAGMFTIGDWLAEVSLMTDADKQSDEPCDEVTLLTAHSSKGLEFNYIYVIGMVDELFPSCNGMAGESEVEEERRLFYVALTRARKRATLCYPLSRFKWGEIVDCHPSRFIAEIDQSYLDNQFSSSDRDSYEPRSFGRQGGFASGFERRSERSTYRAVSEQGYQRKTTQHRSTSKSDDFISSASAPVIAPPANMRKVAPSATIAQSVAQLGDLGVGQRVSHQRFGQGVISKIETTSADVKLTVDFGPAGEKVLLQKFAKLTLV